MKLRNLLITGAAIAALSIFGAVAMAADAPAAAPAAPAVAADAAAPAEEPVVEEEEKELTYQEQATLLVDTIIEDYTVRMAALQAIIDMRDDDIAGLKDTQKKLNDNIKLLQSIMKAAQNVDKNLRPIFTAMPDGDQKTTGLDYLDRLIAAIEKYNAAQ